MKKINGLTYRVTVLRSQHIPSDVAWVLRADDNRRGAILYKMIIYYIEVDHYIKTCYTMVANTKYHLKLLDCTIFICVYQ